MHLFKLTCSDDDYRTVHRDTKGKLKMTSYYSVQGDSTMEAEHWRYNSNALAGANQRLVNMEVGYKSEQEGHMCPSIQKREKMRSLDVIGHRSAKNTFFLFFLANGLNAKTHNTCFHVFDVKCSNSLRFCGEYLLVNIVIQQYSVRRCHDRCKLRNSYGC